MHTIPPNSFFFILFISILLFSPFFKVLGIKNNVELDRKPINHVRLYWHNSINGCAPTSIEVVKPHNNNGFGSINMIDNPLTLGPELSSKVVGKAQGFYAVASKEKFGLLMVMNFAFTYGKYNGSTITILGRNEVFDNVREMPVIGGTGHFRFARGYAEARTHDFDKNTGVTNVEYNVYVSHY